MKIHNIYFATSAVVILYASISAYPLGIGVVLGQVMSLTGMWILGTLSQNAYSNYLRDEEDEDEDIKNN